MKKFVVGIATICMFAVGFLSPASVAVADAKCEHISHSDWHTIRFHYDTHSYYGHVKTGAIVWDFFFNTTHPDWNESWLRNCYHDL